SLRLDDDTGSARLEPGSGVPAAFDVVFQTKLRLLAGTGCLLGLIFRCQISTPASLLQLSLAAQRLCQQVMGMGDLVVIVARIAGEFDRLLQDGNCFLLLAQERQGLAKKQRRIGLLWVEPHCFFQERQSFFRFSVADVYYSQKVIS